MQNNRYLPSIRSTQRSLRSLRSITERTWTKSRLTWKRCNSRVSFCEFSTKLLSATDKGLYLRFLSPFPSAHRSIICAAGVHRRALHWRRRRNCRRSQVREWSIIWHDCNMDDRGHICICLQFWQQIWGIGKILIAIYKGSWEEGENCLVRILTLEFQVKAAKTNWFNDSFFANCMINIVFFSISGLASWRRCWMRQTPCFKSSVRCVQLSKGTSMNSFHSFQCTNKHILAVEAKFITLH